MYNHENNQLYEITPMNVEEPKKKKKILSRSFFKSAVAFVLGVGVTFGAVSISLPKMVVKQMASKITYTQRDSSQ